MVSSLQQIPRLALYVSGRAVNQCALIDAPTMLHQLQSVGFVSSACVGDFSLSVAQYTYCKYPATLNQCQRSSVIR